MERCLFPVRLNSYHSSIFYFHKIQIRVRHCKTFTGSGCSAGWAENLCTLCTARCRTCRCGECCSSWLCFAGSCWADIWQSIFLLQGIPHTIRGRAGPLCQMLELVPSCLALQNTSGFPPWTWEEQQQTISSSSVLENIHLLLAQLFVNI